MRGFLIRATLICEQSYSEKCAMTFFLTAGTRGPCKPCPLNLGSLYQSLQGFVPASMFIGARSVSLPEGRDGVDVGILCLLQPSLKMSRLYLGLDRFVLFFMFVACYATMALLCKITFPIL